MSDVIERLKRDFKDPEYRHTYDEGFLNSSIATQIKVLREEREWTQAELASFANMNQSRISELEDVNFGSWTIRTLRRLAKAFDLRLVISFEEFGTLLKDFKNLNRQGLSRRSFTMDSAFRSVPELSSVAASPNPKVFNIEPYRMITLESERFLPGREISSSGAIEPKPVDAPFAARIQNVG